MHNIIRFTAAINKVTCANPADCLEESRALLADRAVGDADIAVFPRLSLCSPSCGSLFAGGLLLEQCAVALGGLQAATTDRNGYVIAGLAMDDCGKAVSAMAMLHKGELIGFIPTLDNPYPFSSKGYSQYVLPIDTVFACGELRFCVLSCALSGLAMRVVEIAHTGCDLIIVPAYSPAFAGQEEEITSLLAGLSRSLGVAIAVINGGVGDTSFPYVYRGFASIFECGTELAYMQSGFESASCTVDIDVDIIHSMKKSSGCPNVFHSIPPVTHKPGLIRAVERTPFLPAFGRDEYLTDLFELQVRSLVVRMENIGVSKLVLGVSGGLDSTAALLVCAKATDILGLPRENIIGVTMPGFGTTDQTYYNALRLMENLGVTMRDISIREAVQQHFEEIGHGGNRDAVYENAQARERTQVLLDIANAVSGIMVGTGNLSEEALGFSTFAGDHMANYNVNACIAKTVLRELVWYVVGTELVQGVAEITAQILETPVSPELLPSESGEISQKTEDILGPYELHDFFLYHFLRYRMRPQKILFYADVAFSDTLAPEFIHEKLRLFIQRFCGGQFKRSCSPDCASITEINLCGVNFEMPSDLDPAFLLQDLG